MYLEEYLHDTCKDSCVAPWREEEEGEGQLDHVIHQGFELVKPACTFDASIEYIRICVFMYLYTSVCKVMLPVMLWRRVQTRG